MTTPEPPQTDALCRQPGKATTLYIETASNGTARGRNGPSGQPQAASGDRRSSVGVEREVQEWAAVPEGVGEHNAGADGHPVRRSRRRARPSNRHPGPPLRLLVAVSAPSPAPPLTDGWVLSEQKSGWVRPGCPPGQRRVATLAPRARSRTLGNVTTASQTTTGLGTPFVLHLLTRTRLS